MRDLYFDDAERDYFRDVASSAFGEGVSEAQMVDRAQPEDREKARAAYRWVRDNRECPI